jgi:uroporphyrinogen-III synthase
MRIILTRPTIDNESLARALAGHGHNVIHAPLLRIEPRPRVELPAFPYQAVVFSSANAARTIATHTDISRIANVPAFAVGEQSAAAARRAGFRNVITAGGNAVGLAEALISRLQPRAGPILYLSGADVASDLAGRIGNAGFSVTRLVLYDAIATDRLPSEAEAAIRDQRGGGVLLYSPRTAAIWRDLLDRAGLAPGPLVHYCLSANVAAALAASYKVEVAERPSEASILALLGIKTDGNS